MRILALVLGLALLLSMGIGGAVHASERVCDAAELSQLGHQDGKSSDSDKLAPHAHGCHGHHFATSPVAAGRSALPLRGDRLTVRDDFRLPQTRAGPELRPPQA